MGILTDGLTAIPAIVCGIIALIRIRKSGGALRGKGRAITGLVTGCIVLMIPMLDPLGSGRVRENARRANCASNIRGIGFCIAMYADLSHNKLPHTLDDLTNVTSSTRIFFCLSAKDRKHYSYDLTGVTNLWQSDPDVIILREKPANHQGKGGNVLYNDGRVAWLPAANR